MTVDRPRLIEVAFPLKQASLDSVHEKNVRHGHISTLHIWPARRPLAASRAALIATLLPDPGTEAERRRLLELLGGRVVTRNTFKNVGGRNVPVIKEETEGGILHWGRENGPALEFFREEIKKAYGGRAPRVLDPFAGGGAIPLEAMRLGCEVTAIDINPVAWFILKCTLEYPQRLAGQKRPLPAWALTLGPSPRGRGKRKPQEGTTLPLWHHGQPGVPPALVERARDLRRCGTTAEAILWECLRDRQLAAAKFRRQHVIGPYIADFYCHEARLVIEVDGGVHLAQQAQDQERQANLEAQGYRVMRFTNERVLTDTDTVLAEIAEALPSTAGRGAGGEGDLADHVRAWGHWVLERARRDLERFYPTVDGKPTVAYLWARTVTCKNCRATIPLLKTLWLCRKDNKRFRLELKPRADKSGVDFEVVEVRPHPQSLSQRERETARHPSPSGRGAGGEGRGTMSRSGAWCPVCGGPGTVSMTLDDIRAEGMAGRLGAQMTAVVVTNPSPRGRGARGEGAKEYRLPTREEIDAASEAARHVDEVFQHVPFGLPTEPLPTKEALGFRVPLYGFDQWYKLFTPRQLVALGTFVKHTRAAREAMRAEGYPPEWVEAVSGYLALLTDKVADRGSTLCIWISTNAEKPAGSFGRFALPITWDFVEVVPWTETAGGVPGTLQHMQEYLGHALAAVVGAASAVRASAATYKGGPVDVVVTDPPYYDAIPYSDLMDFFYVWLKRSLQSLSRETDEAFNAPLGPKWDYHAADGELIDDAHRFQGDAETSRRVYEDGMFRAFHLCGEALSPEGRMVVVFANKQPEAWETLVSSMIRAGFVVDGSWPIQTERGGRLRSQTSAALSSSVWLVCRKRPETARPGWDTQVLEEMRSRIYDRLRDFWDAGIRGPDFVWAATGPALEAYSKHPVVKKADEPNSLMSVSEFLQHVRRIVVDYVVGRVLTLTPDPSPSGRGEGVREELHIDLDDVTLYYLLHRHDFGLEEAPVGASILYAQSCNLRDRDLADRFDILAYGRTRAVDEAEGDEDEEVEPSPWSADLPSPSGRGIEGEGEPTSGSTVKLKRWDQRRQRDLGLNPGGRPSPLIDQAHHIMHLWRSGDVQKVDAYLEDQGLRRNPVFPRLLQALVELARRDNQHDERVLLETIMNHLGTRGAHPQMRLRMDGGHHG